MDIDIPFLEWVGIALSLVFSAFFSASETALLSLSDHKTQKLVETGNRMARGLVLWRDHPNQVITTILVGNNICNITASVLASDLAARYFEANAIPISIGVMTFLILFFGEISPKTLARAYAEPLSIFVIQVLRAIHFALFPAIWTITKFTRGLIHTLGGRTEAEASMTEEDLTYMLRLGAKAGAIDKEQEDLFHSVIDFSDTIAREIMKPRTEMVALPVDAPYGEVLETVRGTGLSRIPVYEENIDKVVGIFYSKYLITRPRPEEMENYLSRQLRPPVFVPESKKISEILKLFQTERIHMAIVVNEFGGTEGLVTLEDVIEELLGEIRDEFDLEEDDRLVPQEEGVWMADARVELAELEEVLDVVFPEERGYDTLGGFLMEMAGQVPKAGWRIEFGGYDFAVKEANKNKVSRVRIQRLEQPGENEAEEVRGA